MGCDGAWTILNSGPKDQPIVDGVCPSGWELG
jgi:hypothetical protein